MTKFSNSSFSLFSAALNWRLPIVDSHFKRVVGLYRLNGRAIVQRKLVTLSPAGCFPGSPKLMSG